MRQTLRHNICSDDATTLLHPRSGLLHIPGFHHDRNIEIGTMKNMFYVFLHGALFDFAISDPRKSVAHHDSQEHNAGEKTADVRKPGDTAAAKP